MAAEFEGFQAPVLDPRFAAELQESFGGALSPVDTQDRQSVRALNEEKRKAKNRIKAQRAEATKIIQAAGATTATMAERMAASALPVLPDTSQETVQIYVMNKLAEKGEVIWSEGEWWQFGAGKIPGVWTTINEEVIWNLVREINGVETLESASADKAGKRIHVSAALCRGVVDLGKARFSQRNAFNDPTKGIATPKGFWVCGQDRGFYVRQGEPDDRVRMYVLVDPVREEPTLWHSLLWRMWGHEDDFEERVRFLHEWLGATLNGVATKYQTSPILVGEGENGKSVVIDVISGLVPNELRCNVKPSDLETNRFTSQMLVGKILNVVGEIPATELLSSAVIKSVVDGTEILGEKKNKDGFSFRSIAGNLWSCNGLPPTRDLSHGFFRRFSPLTCTAPKITAAEKRPNLAREIIDAEHGKILWAAMSAYQDMIVDGRGYTAVPSVEAARGAWRADSDNVAQWLEENCTRGGDTDIRTLYSDYTRFTQSSGTRPVSMNNFSHRLNTLGVPKIRRADARARELTLNNPVSMIWGRA